MLKNLLGSSGWTFGGKFWSDQRRDHLIKSRNAVCVCTACSFSADCGAPGGGKFNHSTQFVGPLKMCSADSIVLYSTTMTLSLCLSGAFEKGLCSVSEEI